MPSLSLRNLSAMLVLLATLATSYGQATAPRPTTGPSPANVLAPYIDAGTFLVAHADLSKVDTAALEKFALTLFDEAMIPPDEPTRAGLPMVRTMVDTFLTRFKQLGGRHIYLVLAQEDLWPGMSGPAVLLQIEPGGNAQGMIALIESLNGANGREGGPPKPVLIGENMLCMANPATLKRLQQLKPQIRPDLALAGNAADNAVAEAVLALTEDQKRVIHELLPVLPPEAGGDSIRPITSHRYEFRVVLPPDPLITLQWKYTGFVPPPNFNPTIPFPFDSLSYLIVRWRDSLLANTAFWDRIRPDFKPILPEIHAFLTEVLTPKTGGWRLQMDSNQIRAFAKILRVEAAAARARAQQPATPPAR